jgi:hypothetical protein
MLQTPRNLMPNQGDPNFPQPQQFPQPQDPNAALGAPNPLANMFGGAGADQQNQLDLQMQTQVANDDAARTGGAPATPGTPGSAFGGQMSGYADQIYNESLRRLNPEWETRSREFEQSLVGRGIDPNSEAGRQARQQFDASRADAFSSARRQADQGALGYQNQMWQQQFAQDESRNASRRAMLQNAAAGANRSDDLRFRERQFNEDTRRYDQGFSEDSRRYNQGFDLGMNQNDFAQMMALMGFDRDSTGFNNQAGMNEINSILPFLNLIPQGGPTGIDVMSPYQLQQNAQQFNAQQQQQRNNGFWSSIGQIGQAALPFLMASDERVKDKIRQVGTLHNGLPVYAYRYVTGGPTMIGVMAQDVEQVKPEAVVEVNGVKLVNYDLAVA